MSANGWSDDDFHGGEVRELSDHPKIAHPQDTLTDTSNAIRLADKYGGEELRYVFSHKRWYFYNNARWEPDTTGAAMRRAKGIVRELHVQAANEKSESRQKSVREWATKSESAARLRAMLEVAQSDKRIATAPDRFDRDPMLLNFTDVTVDLNTGEVLDHEPEHLLTKSLSVPYERQATCPMWERFLERVQPDPEMRGFLQRAVGYSLCGLTTEQVFFLLWGVGANGKSVFIEILFDLLGHYALKVQSETFLAKRNDGIPNDIAQLQGARLIAAVEIEAGRRIAESRIKELTGGDTVSARFLHAEFFTFKPVGKLWLVGNSKPQIKGTDEAIWRRVRLLPFEEVIPERERDPELTQKLREELPGIAQWAMKGFRQWQEGGLQAPEKVLAATAEYREDEDLVRDFLNECCERKKGEDGGAIVTKADLYRAFREYHNGKPPLTQKSFGQRMIEMGFDDTRDYKLGRCWLGVSVISPQVEFGS